jgi:amino acid transporter
LSEAPLALAADKALGNQGVILLSFIALFATSNTALMMLISASRIIYGMSRNTKEQDGNSSNAGAADTSTNSYTKFSKNAFPSLLAKIHPIRKTPWLAIIIAMACAMLTVGFSSGDISGVANISVFGIFLVYASVNLCLIWHRFKKPRAKRPFLAPLSIGKFPILAGIGLIASIAMLFQFSFEVMKGGVLVLAAIMIVCLILSKNESITTIVGRIKKQ